MMDPTPPLYVFFPPGYQSTQGPPPPPPQDGGQLSPLIIFFIALAALIALLIMICLIVMIYNVCRYGSCCPPSANGSCCAPSSANGSCCAPTSTIGCCCCYCTPCCVQTEGGSFVKPSPIIVQSPSYGSYVSRGTRLNQGSYAVGPPRSIRAGTIPSRRNSIIVVGQNSLPRRQVVQTVRPQIMITDGGRAPTMGRSSLLALPCSSSSSQSAIRCFPRNEPMSYGNYNDDGEVRVIVRNQPYADSQRGIIIEAPPSSSISPQPVFQNTGGMGYGGGCGGGGLDHGGDFGYGFSGGGGQHSATVDVCFDQVPEYTSDDGIHQFQQTAIYPSLGDTNIF